MNPCTVVFVTLKREIVQLALSLLNDLTFCFHIQLEAYGAIPVLPTAAVVKDDLHAVSANAAKAKRSVVEGDHTLLGSDANLELGVFGKLIDAKIGDKSLRKKPNLPVVRVQSDVIQGDGMDNVVVSADLDHR
jgi:hypothetical protein